MKRNNFITALVLLIAGFVVASCGSTTLEPQLTLENMTDSIPTSGGTVALSFTCNDAWSVDTTGFGWLKLSQVSGIAGDATINATVSANLSTSSRYKIIYVRSTNGQARRVVIYQAAAIYPSYNTSPIAPDATGMSSTAVELAAKMTLGINIGNTMEAFRTTDGVVISDEEAWGNKKITEDYIKFLKATGFNAVRIPCSWNQGNLSDKAKMKINPIWLNRVKEVVQYCANNDMYVLLNIHWDGGWLDDNINDANKEITNAKMKALWEQIATTMRDFDEHLMFAGANEPPVENAQGMAILNSYYETFIKAVRATGGKNSYRTLVVQGPGTNATKAYDLMNIPNDPTPNRLMLEVHEYTPSQFCFVDKEVLGTWEVPVFYWGAGNHSTIEPERNATYGEEDAILDSFRKLKEKFISKGVPVVLGEYAAMRRDKSINTGIKFIPKDMVMHNKSVDYWNTFVTRQCHINGVVPFYWEVGNVLNRTTNVVKDQAMVDALKAGVN